MIPVIYEELCSICGGDLSWEEIEKRICEKKKKPLCYSELEDKVKEFKSLFTELVGAPRKIQEFWMRRLIKGESFTAVAPTGVGKTTFGLVASLFFLFKEQRSYIIVPTTLLVEQTVEELERFLKKLGKKPGLNQKAEITVLYYHGKLKKSEKKAFKELIEKNEYDVLITTTQFLAKNFHLLKDKTFDFVFVDDVDAVLKSSRNVDKILMLLGFRKLGKKWIGKPKGVLMVSTATAKKGRSTVLFRELLNFDVGSSSHASRNIEDIIVPEKTIDALKKILKIMGRGGIIYARTTEEAQEIYECFKHEFKIGIVTANKKADYELFEKGELEYLVGTAYYYGTMVRGLDLPERIRFVVFFGAPVFRTKYENLTPKMARILVLTFREHMKEFLPLLNRFDSDPTLLEKVGEKLKELSEIPSDVVIKENEIIFPDIKTYIQGSGRASRLMIHGLTKGASFLLEDNEKIRNAFVKRAGYYDISFKTMDEVDFKTLIKEIDETRKKGTGKEDITKPVLFIVESPTKARTISRFFGKPSVKVGDIVVYEIPTPKYVLLITASLGHIVDLTTERGLFGVEDHYIPIYTSIKRCRICSHQFTENKTKCPKCGSEEIDDSMKRIRSLRELARDVGFVIIGTDPDTEGEKIAWDIKNLLSGCGEIKRAEFHEVTRKAINEALSNLREIDENRVKAQIVRRIEDRWLGFSLSQILQQHFKDRNLSAGRAQSPVLGWIIERHRKYLKKRKVGIWREYGIVFSDVKEPVLEITVKKEEEKIEEKTPLPPYTTDSMLRDANSILKLSAKETMSLAQDLFENGLITYHRTDSTRVSEVGLSIAKEVLGKEFTPRTWETEGAHECIRPTRPYPKDLIQRLIAEGIIVTENISWKHLALYDLIFRRFMASQCPKYLAKTVFYSITYNGKTLKEERVTWAEGRALEYYRWSVWIKPELPEGTMRIPVEIRAIPEERLFTQSEVIQTMKEKGIGRPSTYATLLDKLFLRKYVVERSGKLIPTKKGISVFTYLKRNYEKFISEERTRILEKKMDMIEEGKKDYIEALKELEEEISEILPDKVGALLH